MAAGDTLTIHMTGGAPWGFRLYGGEDDPLVVAKLRKRSKAHEAGLLEGDCLLGINSYGCQGISHGTAMTLVEGTNDLSLQILRGSSDRHAVDAAFQALGEKLRPVPASALPQGASPVPRSQASPAPPAQASPAAPKYQLQVQHEQQQQPQPQPQQSQVVNGYSALSEPTQISRREQTFKEGDTTTHVTTETSEQKLGGTTVTKVKRQTVTQSYGQGPAKPMFKVANVGSSAPAAQNPGVWNPSGIKVDAPSGVHVQQNPDQSITMTIGLDDSKENIAPFQEPAKSVPPLFKVSKFGSNDNAPGPGVWNVGTPPQTRASPQPGTDSIPLLPDEEAEMQKRLDALKKPFPVQLQRVLVESGVSDHESGSDSPTYLTRRRMDSFEFESDDDDFGPKKKMFADSAFYDDPEHKYPTIEEQVKMARKVAMSLLAPMNKKARGHRMFVRRMVKSQKWTTDEERQEKDFEAGEVEEEEKYYNPNPWSSQGHTWNPPEPVAAPPSKPPPPPPIPANLFKLPTLPTGPKKDERSKALSADEFERMRLFESKTDHTQVSPQMCFDLANDLRNMKGKGGKLFAKRVARAEKWDTDEKSSEGANKPNQDLINKIAMQAAASGAVQMPGMGMPMPGMGNSAPGPARPAETKSDGMPVNRLKQMIDPPKPKMTPWDAAADYDGNIDQAFEHLKGYRPYGNSQQGDIAKNLDNAVKKGPGSFTAPATGPSPVSSLPTSGQPAKLPEFTRKIKPWGSSDSGSSAASGASFSTPASQPASGFSNSSSQSFKRIGFKAPGLNAGSFQPGGTSGSSFGGAASFGRSEEVGFCDL